MEITLSDLRTLSAQCAALSDANVLGFMTDIALDAMRARANKRIEKEPQYKELQKEKKGILERIQNTEGYKELTDTQKAKVITEDQELIAYFEKEKTEFWDKEVTDIEFDTVIIEWEKGNAHPERFRDKPIATVPTIDGMNITLNLYGSLRSLIEKGLIKVT